MKITIDIHSISSFSTGLVVNLVEYNNKTSFRYEQWFYKSLEG